MLVLALKTDQTDCELGLYENGEQTAETKWPAGRQLAETIHQKIQELLTENGKQLTDLQGIACFNGPGSFTGLRIGLTVANALADSYSIPIVSAGGKNWKSDALNKLSNNQNEGIALPEYGYSQWDK